MKPWIEERYNALWEKFGETQFYKEDAFNFLNEKFRDDEDKVLTILSELRKEGLIETKQDEKDARKSIYKLKPNEFVKKLGRGDIEAILKRAADLIRTRVDYKFILILLFLKRISDKWEEEFEQAYKEALEDGLSEEEAKEEAKKDVFHTFNLPEECLWENIRKDIDNLPENLTKALKKVAELNPELKDVVDSIDFIQFTSSRENLEILRQLFELFSEKKLTHVSPDVLGDAYEWILKYFAPQKAKEGEVYTPREVIKLLVEILEPKPKEEVYDPCCGSGGMLILSYNYVKNRYGKDEAEKLFLYGQEANHTTLALCKMNLYIHDIINHNIIGGNTLSFPKFKEYGRPKQFDIVIANPPWNQDGYDENTLKKGEFWKERFSYGFPPKQSADWAWIQHMLASAKDNGRIGIVIDNGCLFRGGKEGIIRSKIVESDLIECVILLPEKLFYNTGAPGAIIILRKKKPEERRGKILFINASQEYENHPEVRRLNRLGDKNIQKIVEAYRNFKNIEGFAKVVSLDEIKKNDYNLNVTLYVMDEEGSEEINLINEFSELEKLEKERDEITKKVKEYISQIIKADGE